MKVSPFRPLAFAPSLLLWLLGASTQAQTPELVSDLETSTGASLSKVRPIAAARGTLLFAVDEVDRGEALWITDGSPEGTRSFTQLCPGDCDGPSFLQSQIDEATFDGERAYFLYDDGIHGLELWTADGSEAGTRLVADLCPGSCSLTIRDLTIVGPKVFFRANTEEHGAELWVSDGSAAGTHLVADLEPGPDGSFPSQFVPFGDGVAFRASTSALGSEFMRSDGTAEGTVVLADLCPGPCSGAGPSSLGIEGDGMLATTAEEPFTGGRSFREALYRFDPDGTVERLLVMCEGTDACDNQLSRIYAAGDRYYLAEAGQLFSTDGTVLGSRLALTLPSEESFLRSVIQLPSGERLLSFDNGDVGSTEIHELIDPGFGDAELRGPLLSTFSGLDPVVFGDRAVVLDGAVRINVYSFTGTPLGAVLEDSVAAPVGSPVDLGRLYALSEAVVFLAESRLSFFGQEVYATEADAGSTRRLFSERQVAGSSDPRELAPVGERIVAATRPATSAGDLVATRGTAVTTTTLAEDLRPMNLEPLGLDVGDRVFFYLGLGTGDVPRKQPWITDGTSSGTFPLGSPGGALRYGREPLSFGGQLYFLADLGGGQKIWRTDGLSPTAELVVDLEPDWTNIHEGCVCSPPIQPGPIFPRDLRVLGQGDGPGDGARLVFVGGALESGAELWTSDGTAAGTELVADLRPGAEGSEPEDLVIAGDHVVFTADDGSGRGLWSWTPGSAPARLRDAGEITTAIPFGASAAWLERSEDTFSLETSAGTNTARIHVFEPGAVPDDVLVEAGGRLFFVLADGDGDELWTATLLGGAAQVADLRPGPRGSRPRELAEIGGALYWSANDGSSGQELWRLDPSALVPELVADLAPGDASSAPANLAPLPGSDAILFSAHRDDVGREIWRLGKATAACDGDPLAHCLRGGRFKVTARWRIPATGEEGVGTPIPATDDSGFFWFFSESNVELVIKVLDGRDFNDAYWLFYGALSDVEYWIEAEDLLTGATRTYYNPPGDFCGEADTEAFPKAFPKASPKILAKAFPPALPSGFPVVTDGALPLMTESRAAAPKGIDACGDSETTLCLLDRFEVSVEWRDHAGNEGVGTAVPGTEETGFFWFFDQANIELAVKALDGRDFNDAYWIFYGALSDVEYALRVLDTSTGDERLYVNPAGNFCGRADTEAFPGD